MAAAGNKGTSATTEADIYHTHATHTALVCPGPSLDHGATGRPTRGAAVAKELGMGTRLVGDVHGLVGLVGLRVTLARIKSGGTDSSPWSTGHGGEGAASRARLVLGRASDGVVLVRRCQD